MNEQEFREQLGVAMEANLAPHLGQVYTAAAVEVRISDETVYRGAFGFTDPEAVAHSETLFDLGELTELFTTTAFLKCVDAGRLWIDTPVNVLLEEADERLNFYHLLTHTSGLPEKLDLRRLKDYDTRISAIEKAKPTVDPGDLLRYSPLDFLQMGLALEALSTFPFDQTLIDLVLQPLGLNAQFAPIGHLTDAAPNAPDWDREAIDPYTRALDGISGHAGLFGTAADVVTLAQLYMNVGHFEGDVFLNTALASEAVRAHNQDQGFGWKTDGTNLFASSRTGCLVWTLDRADVAAAILTNASYYDAASQLATVFQGAQDALTRVADSL